MKQIIHILIVDDHPMTLWGYEALIKSLNKKYCFDMETAKSCDEVLQKMKADKKHFFDVVLLDINLPASSNGSIINGEDLGLRIQNKFHDTKIIVHTSLNDQQRIANIFESLNPEGFIIKSDLEPKVLEDAINSVLNGHTYYSDRINKLINYKNGAKIFLDTLDQKILYHLSKGERMKDLPKNVPLAMATIERRKKKLKMLFGIPDGNDKELLDEAREKGYI
ncbi:response regulator [Flagellimonas sp.]|uniref:response regulator n=1 Tax=Flagellimonas sp. TaxID=2058762 RepID=UPI003B508731